MCDFFWWRWLKGTGRKMLWDKGEKPTSKDVLPGGESRKYLFAFLSSLERETVGRMVSSNIWPHPNPWNICILPYLGKRVFVDMTKLRILR